MTHLLHAGLEGLLIARGARLDHIQLSGRHHQLHNIVEHLSELHDMLVGVALAFVQPLFAQPRKGRRGDTIKLTGASGQDGAV